MFVNKDLFNHAMMIIQPSIDQFFELDAANGRDRLHVVVIAPNGDLFEQSFGADKETWQNPYDEIARRKAAMCQRTGQPSEVVLVRMPWLVEAGDPRYAGGVVEDKLVVACSGLQDYFDEMFSWMILNIIAALCTHKVRVIPDSAPHFIGE